ncbi:crAss001_48 related protein [Agathobaculum sp.]|uniref:crAss001_48 related protein n=1 Tax=Agathobaculum sp. TaxID=2048138 RepID=UPI0027B8B4CD|nr:hypothetical protein [Agathobaculum sp.]
MELKDTVILMTSPDYRDRFRAEYLQLTIRMEKLQQMLQRLAAKKLDFEPACPPEMLYGQLRAMMNYQQYLVLRAREEGIKLE